MPQYRLNNRDPFVRWNQQDIKQLIKFNHVVRDVQYNKATDDFTVSVKDTKKDQVNS